MPRLRVVARLYYPSSCRDSPDDVRAVGWVFGYFVPSRRLYAEGAGGGTPTLLWMEGSSGKCRVEYALSGGPWPLAVAYTFATIWSCSAVSAGR